MTTRSMTKTAAHRVPEFLCEKIMLMKLGLNPTPSAACIKDITHQHIPTYLHPKKDRIGNRDHIGGAENWTDEELENWEGWDDLNWGDFLYHYLNCGYQKHRVKHHPKLFKYIKDKDGYWEVVREGEEGYDTF